MRSIETRRLIRAGRRYCEAAIEFKVGYKCLTERGVARVRRLIKAAVKLYGAEYVANGCKMEIERYELYRRIVVGLNNFSEGCESGFKSFEDMRVLDAIDELYNYYVGLK